MNCEKCKTLVMNNTYKFSERKIRRGVFPGEPNRPGDGYAVLRDGIEVAFIAFAHGAWYAFVNGTFWTFSTRKSALEFIIEQLETR